MPTILNVSAGGWPLDAGGTLDVHERLDVPDLDDHMRAGVEAGHLLVVDAHDRPVKVNPPKAQVQAEKEESS